MADIRWRGTKRELLRRLSQYPGTFAGRVPDEAGVVPGLFHAVGLTALDKLYQHYDRLSQGGVGDDGTVWRPLSVVTLILRRKGTGRKAVARLRSAIADAP